MSGQLVAASAAYKRFAERNLEMDRIHFGPFEFHKRAPAGTGGSGGTLTCAVSKRVPRLYLEGGAVVERSLRLLP